MKPKAVKSQELAELTEEFQKVESVFLVQFEGLTVVAVDDLRRKVRQSAGRYRVVKNTLARRAAEGTAAEGLREHLTGPTAVVSTEEDPTQVAKTLADFAKTNPAVVVKAGVVDGAVLDASGCEALANVPSKEELQARLVGLFAALPQRLVGVLSAPSRNLAVVVRQGAEKRGEES